jgi:hypothetical protein
MKANHADKLRDFRRIIVEKWAIEQQLKIEEFQNKPAVLGNLEHSTVLVLQLQPFLWGDEICMLPQTCTSRSSDNTVNELSTLIFIGLVHLGSNWNSQSNQKSSQSNVVDRPFDSKTEVQF